MQEVVLLLGFVVAGIVALGLFASYVPKLGLALAIALFLVPVGQWWFYWRPGASPDRYRSDGSMGGLGLGLIEVAIGACAVLAAIVVLGVALYALRAKRRGRALKVQPDEDVQTDAPRPSAASPLAAAFAGEAHAGAQMQTRRRDEAPPLEETGVLLSAELIAVLVLLFLAAWFAGTESGPVTQGLFAFLLGLHLTAWGAMFLMAYHFSHKAFFLRWLMWICEHASYPRGRKMAFFYFTLAAGVGSVAIAKAFGIW